MTDRGANGRFVNLRDYLESRLTDALNKINSDREADNQAVEVALAAVNRERIIHSEAHEREHLSHMREHALNQKALDLSADLAKENKVDSNKWRATMSDKDRTYATLVLHETLEKEVQGLREANIARAQSETDRTERDRLRLDEAERRLARQQWVIGTIVAIATIAIAVVLQLIHI